jgi:hypothetical protein
VEGRPRSQIPVAVSCGTLLLAVLALIQSLLAPAAAIATLIAFLVVLRAAPAQRWRYLLMLSAAALLSTFAFVQFLRTKAIAGIVQGGTRATEGRAVSRLREILFAEDAVRRRPEPELDQDGDGVGSAALIASPSSPVSSACAVAGASCRRCSSVTARAYTRRSAPLTI